MAGLVSVLRGTKDGCGLSRWVTSGRPDGCGWFPFIRPTPLAERTTSSTRFEAGRKRKASVEPAGLAGLCSRDRVEDPAAFLAAATKGLSFYGFLSAHEGGLFYFWSLDLREPGTRSVRRAG